MRIAIGQINTTVGALQANTDKVLDIMAKAREAGANLVILPELAITGYPPMDLLDRPQFIQSNLNCLEQIRAASQGLAVIVGFVARNEANESNALFNAAAVIEDGHYRLIQHKSLLPTYDVFDEDRHFEPARAVHAVELGGYRVGVTICEDIWNDEQFWSHRLYDHDPLATLYDKGCNFFINISASPFHHQKTKLRHDMIQAIVRKYRVPMVYVNLASGNDSLIFDGHSMVFDAQAQLRWMGQGFAEDFVVLDLNDLPPALPTPPLAEEIALIEQALVLGVRDYVRKSGFKQVVLGLSGGIDSAVTAVIAQKALGSENVLGVAMPSQYSSQGSLDDARQLATNLGIDYRVIPIKHTFAAYQAALAEAFANRPEDVAEENLQARIRGNLLMALSNKFGHLLLTTGNKSEMAVGYCTLYGDMCGGLAVISDLPKTWVYQLAEHMNQDAEVIPLNTITKPPSAELRPDQKDQDTLPAYEVLDAILQAYVEENKSWQDIVAQGFDEKTVKWVIWKINTNEYKRRQAPPGLKVTRKSFGHGRRYPIARGYD